MLYTDKKENQIFLIYKDIQNGAVAKSYLTNSLLIYKEIFAHFLTYDFATAPLWISLIWGKYDFLFISVQADGREKLEVNPTKGPLAWLSVNIWRSSRALLQAPG